MVKPYYDDGKGIVIYHGDCREILPSLGTDFALVVDPPYGIAYQHSGGGNGLHRRRNSLMPIVGDSGAFDPTEFLVYPAMFLLGADHFRRALPEGGTWIAWDKSLGIGPRDSFADCEFAWTNLKVKRNCFRILWKGIACTKVDSDGNAAIRVHPTQKPTALMKEAVLLMPESLTILDPFMGSGTTLRAAKDLGRKAIGIEIEEKYCEIAVRRLAQEVLL